MTDVRILLGGREYRTQSISVERSLDAASGTFSATIPLVPGALPRPEQTATVQVTGLGDGPAENLLIGFADIVGGQVSPGERRVSIQGRDRTADLIDGVPLAAPSSWKDASLAQIARDLALPLGLEVIDLAGAEDMVLPRHSAQPGQSAMATIQAAAERFGVLVGPEPTGGLILGVNLQGRARVPLLSGENGNVVDWSWRSDHSQRFRRVRVRGNSTGGLAGILEGQVSPEATAVDPEIRGQRELDVVAQGNVTQEDCRRLAAWHASVRRARSFQLEVVVPSWRQGPGGPVWKPGLTAHLGLGEIDDEGDMLIDAVRLTLDRSGELAALRLIRPRSLDQDPTKGVDAEPGGLAALL